MSMCKSPVKFRAEKSQSLAWASKAVTTPVLVALRWLGFVIRWMLTLTVATACLYQVVASPPLHLMGFPVKPAAGESSIYVPGESSSRRLIGQGIDAIPKAPYDSLCIPLSLSNVIGSGFSGVWFHLGFLQSLPTIHDHDFYCYSSGCLSTYHHHEVKNTVLKAYFSVCI